MPTNSSNVDAFRHACVDPLTGTVTGVEPALTDHTADITFSNTKFPTATASFNIRILSYTISYQRNGACPSTAQACPSLAPISAQQTIVIDAGSTVVRTFPLVPLSVKADFARNFDTRLPIPVLSYSARYVFTAQTIGFTDTFTVEAGTEFTISDFDTCGG